MRLLEIPRQLIGTGLKFPELYIVSAGEEIPPPGVSFIRGEDEDYVLLFRLLVPILMQQHKYFDWYEIYRELTGKTYYFQRIYQAMPQVDNPGASHHGSTPGFEQVALEELAADRSSEIDINVLSELRMLPTFMEDIREAVTINVTNSWHWTDGFNKKTGICSGYLTQQPPVRNLVIIDISNSIPDGVSAGMMTLLKTIGEITHADLILTGGQSYFYKNEEIRHLNIHEERRRIPRSNESVMFRKILEEQDMDYTNVITFGDSDNPGCIKLNQQINTQNWYSFFISGHDTYGNSASFGTGYGRWVKEANPRVNFISNTSWARFFTNGETR